MAIAAPVDHVVADLGCEPLNMVSDATGRYIASDCSDGTVHLLRGTPTPGLVLHRHAALAFGIAWWGPRLCSGGWDGAVLCTNVETNETTVIARHTSRIRWVAATANFLTYSVADGSVWWTDGGPPRML